MKAPPRKVEVIAAVLLILGIAFRWWATDYARFTGDESLYWAESRRLAIGQHIPAYGPAITGSSASLPGAMYYYLMAIPQFFGSSPKWGSVFVVFLHALSAFLFFDFARRARGDRAGLLALAVVAFAPWDVLYADRIWGSCVVPVWGAVAIYAAIRSSESTAWQGVLVFVSLVLPQLHMSVPVLWSMCFVILVLRRPARIGWRSIAIGLGLTILAYAHPMWLELTRGFPNTQSILHQAGGGESWETSRLIPLKVFGYAVLYGTSEIGYHFARGYWGGNFTDIFTQDLQGWNRWFQLHGVIWSAANIVSILLGFACWGFALVSLAKRARRAVAARSRAELELGDVLNIALFVGLACGAVLMMLAKKKFFPHYANILVPFALWPIVSALDELWARPRWRAPLAIAIAVSVAAMISSAVRYYRNVDSLNGQAATIAMVGEVLAQDEPFDVQFDKISNLYAWQEVSNMLYGRPLPASSKARLRYRVRNDVPYTGEVPPGGKLFGSLLLERKEDPRAALRVLHARKDWESARVESISPDGKSRACVARTDGKKGCMYGDQPWQHFAPEMMDIGGVSEGVLFMHPMQGSAVRATFPVPETAAQGIVYYGLSDGATKSTNTSPVEVRVLQGSETRGRADAGNQTGLKQIAFTLTSTGAREIAVEIRTKNDGARIFGFDLELLRGGAR